MNSITDYDKPLIFTIINVYGSLVSNGNSFCSTYTIFSVFFLNYLYLYYYVL